MDPQGRVKCEKSVFSEGCPGTSWPQPAWRWFIGCIQELKTSIDQLLESESSGNEVLWIIGLSENKLSKSIQINSDSLKPHFSPLKLPETGCRYLSFGTKLMFDWLNQAKSIEIQCQWLHHVSSCYIRISSWVNRFISKFKSQINYIHKSFFFAESSTLFEFSSRFRGATWAPKGSSPGGPRPRDRHLGNHLPRRGWKKWWKPWGEIRTVTTRVIPVIRCYNVRPPFDS